VYAREGLPCVRCGAPIRRIVVAQRGTHYCPKCQR
jgi:formamidopyrimidine-DNA glycosylase